MGSLDSRLLRNGCCVVLVLASSSFLLNNLLPNGVSFLSSCGGLGLHLFSSVDVLRLSVLSSSCGRVVLHRFVVKLLGLYSSTDFFLSVSSSLSSLGLAVLHRLVEKLEGKYSSVDFFLSFSSSSLRLAVLHLLVEKLVGMYSSTDVFLPMSLLSRLLDSGGTSGVL